MRKIVFSILFMVFAIAAFAAGGVTGRVVDATTKRPIEFVNVVIYNPSTQKNVSGSLTNQEGVFNISAIPNGKFELRVSFVGYNAYTKEVNVSGANIAMATIELSENSKVLKEVSVVGQGSQMRFDIDKKVFSVDQNIAAAGGSATDVLQNIPSVDVDNDGNVSLRNNSSVEIWINGKPSGLTADNRAQVLQQMPAENIESIEIMTNPSAKFNPEGTAGIINLVMKKNRKAGYYGSASAGATLTNGKLGYNAGASINYNTGKWDMFANVGYREMLGKGSGFTERVNTNDGTTLTQNSENDFKMRSIFFRAGADYAANEKNTIGMSIMGHNGKPRRLSTTDYSLMNANTPLRDYSRINDGSDKHQGYNLNLYHKIDFDKKGSNLLTNVIYSRNSNFGEQRYTQSDKMIPANAQDITQIADGNMQGWELKSDFTKKFNDNTRLELGWSSRINDRLSKASGFNHLTGKDIAAYYNEFDFADQVHALYATYGTRINNFSLQGGLRGEYYRGESTTKPAETAQPIINSYFQIFPSLFLSYSLPKSNEVQLNITRRVNRPWGRQVNSFRDYSDSTNISYGNPALTPEFASVMELNYLKNWSNHSVSSTIYYRFTDDVMQRVSFMRDGVMESTFMNLTKKRDVGVELVAKNRLFKFLNLTSSVNLYRSALDSATYVHPLDNTIKVGIPSRNNFSWDARVIANLMFTPSFSAQVTGQYRSSELLAQGERLPSYSMDLGLRKTFLDKKLSVNLNVRDLFESRIFKSNTWGTNFTQYSENKMGGRMAGLTVTYNFGNMKPKQIRRPSQSENTESGGEMGTEF